MVFSHLEIGNLASEIFDFLFFFSLLKERGQDQKVGNPFTRGMHPKKKTIFFLSFDFLHND